MTELDRLLSRIDCPPMVEALRAQREEFALECVRSYQAADQETKKDIRAFFESDGPRLVHEVKLKHEEGVPTSGDLEEAFGQ